jgi:predicted cobalt transporter CbtA
MGFFIPVLDQSGKLTCAICRHTSRSGISRFDGGFRVGYLCHTCAENSGSCVVSPSQPGDPLLPVSLRANAWPVLAICLTGIGTAAVVFVLSESVWIALRTILLLLSPHV